MYKIILPNFEGPLDLLLYFIKRDELNIYDIPISRITEEFFSYIKLMQYFDLELAGEFIVMAASLMMIKVQMLLPGSEDSEDSDMEDPRRELVQKLLEYQQFKEASKELAVLADEQKYNYYRKMFDQDMILAKDSAGMNYKNATVIDLLSAFKKVIDRADSEPHHHLISLFSFTVEDRISWIRAEIESKKRISFFDIIKNESKSMIVITFLALLELIKSQSIFVTQDEIFQDIILSQRPLINLN